MILKRKKSHNIKYKITRGYLNEYMDNYYTNRNLYLDIFNVCFVNKET